MPGPLPRLLSWCIYPFLPTRLWPSPPLDWVGAWQLPVQRLQYGAPFRGCSHSVMFRPAGLLATPVAPTAVLLLPVGSWPARFLPVSRRVPHLAEPWTPSSSGQPWLFHLNNSWFVTSPSPRYASRPNRAIDDKGLSPHKIHSLVGCPLTTKLTCRYKAQRNSGRVQRFGQVLLLWTTVMTTCPFLCPVSTYR